MDEKLLQQACVRVGNIGQWEEHLAGYQEVVGSTSIACTFACLSGDEKMYLHGLKKSV